MMIAREAYRKETALGYEQKQQGLQLRRLAKQAARLGTTLQKVNE